MKEETETEIELAIKNLVSELNSDASLRESWRSNLAMAFYDAVIDYKFETHAKYLNKKDIHKIANRGAEEFLALLCNHTKEN